MVEEEKEKLRGLKPDIHNGSFIRSNSVKKLGEFL
jgi:hypothetical protein